MVLNSINSGFAFTFKIHTYISGILFPVHFMVILDGIRREARFEDCRVVR